ncbi:MAG: transposase [Bacteroidetes bacterium]|nr:transposase [Bacteroidota bacterium]
MLLPDSYYHIFNHANGDDNLFREEKNYDFFLLKYHQHIDPIADTIARCLMKKHFHLLVKIKGEEEILSTFPKFRTLEKLEYRQKFISKQFSNFFSSYSQAFNKVYNRQGSLFIKNFKRKENDDLQYLQKVILYIHLNPKKHGFELDFNQWYYTSYHTFIENNTELATDLFTNEEHYFDYHQENSTINIEYQKLENELT